MSFLELIALTFIFEFVAIFKSKKPASDKTYSDFNSSAKLHYAMEKHYSLEELDDEMEI